MFNIKYLYEKILLELRMQRSPHLDMESSFNEIYKTCKPFTLTSKERMYALYKATEYITKHQIPGDIVECGVYKGGSTMLCAMTLVENKDYNRKIFLYDTYEGMSTPTDKDKSFTNDLALNRWEKTQGKDRNLWCYAGIEEVKNNMSKTGYPEDKLIYVKGKVEETIPQTTPQQISILRLDTDWYESTYHELIHLFPLLTPRGVIIIDDYGHWQGAREAIDEYMNKNNIPILLNRIDYTGRIAIKI